MSKWVLHPLWLVFLLFSLLPSAASACAEPGIYPPVTWTTHIASISPQAGIAGVTKIYVRGYCFGTTYGDTSGLGFVSVGGARVPAANVSMWTDAEIVFTLPFTSVSGDFVVTASTSTGYGSDDSASETGCPRSNGWPENKGYS
ncbi:MAG: hypothetical protein KGL59_04155 [Acidobacteriota bacterium]|nr:hypothetical protein [Acidobacteriota bacterium]